MRIAWAIRIGGASVKTQASHTPGPNATSPKEMALGELGCGYKSLYAAIVTYSTHRNGRGPQGLATTMLGFTAGPRAMKKRRIAINQAAYRNSYK